MKLNSCNMDMWLLELDMHGVCVGNTSVDLILSLAEVLTRVVSRKDISESIVLDMEEKIE